MTTIETHADAAGDSVVASFFAGVAAWATTTDHKRIGRIYLGFGLFGLLATAVLGAMLGSERISDSAVFDSDILVQLFQAQRVSLVFAGIIPLTLGLAIAVVPLQLGARQIAFPRLALTGLYAWLGGLVLTFVALGRNGGIGGGDAQAVDQFLAGHGLMILGLLASAGSVAVSVLTTRAPGMTMRRVPLFAWSSLIGALGMIIALPVVFGAIIYLFVDIRLGTAANFGGAEGIGAWIGWVFSVPAVAVFSLPAVGVAAELIPVSFRARQQVRGVAFAGIALVGVTALAAVTTQPTHPVSLDSDQSFGIFFDDLLPFLVFAGLPLLGLLIVMGLGALTAKTGVGNGRPRITAAFLFSFLGMGMVFVGLVGNLLMAITDLELHRHHCRGGRGPLRGVRLGHGRHGWRRLLGAEALGPHAAREARAPARRAVAARHRPGLAPALHRRLARPGRRHPGQRRPARHDPLARLPRQRLALERPVDGRPHRHGRVGARLRADARPGLHGPR